MSKYHGEQYWAEIKHQTVQGQGWRDLDDNDFDTLRSIRHAREVRLREQRARARLEYGETTRRRLEY